MTPPDFSRPVHLHLSLAHALLAWETLSDTFSALRLYDDLSEAERRAIWKLTDEIEKLLTANNICALPQEEWQNLVKSAERHFMRT